MKIETLIATAKNADIIRNLYPLYLYDLAEIYGMLPNEYGVFEEGPIKTLKDQYNLQDAWFQKPGVLFPYIIFSDERPAGFALVGSDKYVPEGVDFHLYEFFLLRPFRGNNIAEIAVGQVFNRHHGKWTLYTNHTDTNNRGQAFWNKAICNYTDEKFDKAVEETFQGMKMVFKFETK